MNLPRTDDEVRAVIKRVLKDNKNPLAKHLPASILAHSGECSKLIYPVKSEIKDNITLKNLMDEADRIARKNKSRWISMPHLVSAIYMLSDGKMETNSLNRISSYLKKNSHGKNINKKAIAMIPGVDLSSKLDPSAKTYGRNKEIDEMIYTLLRKKKSNPVLLGEAGVGKTNIVEELTRRIAKGVVPELKGYTVIEVTLPSLIGGTNLRGTAERRLEEMITIAEQEDVILFIDEVHVVLNPSSINGSDISNIMKPALARGKMKVIAATTLKEWKVIERDGALTRRFNKIIIEELNVPETVKLMIECRDEYSKFHNVEVSDEICKTIVDLSDKYLTSKVQPDKSIDILDVMMSELRCKGNKTTANIIELFSGSKQMKATTTNVLEAISRISGVPIKNLSADEIDLLSNMYKDVEEHVVGQTKAIRTMLSEITKFKLKLTTREKPITFLLAGITGCGKTLTVKTIAKLLYGKDSAFIRFDMSEFRERHTASRLIGAPPGFIGYEQGGELTEAVKNNPYCIVLFDEIEKCHHDIKNVLLQVCGEGRLKDANGAYIDFTNTIITMTSNIGSNDVGDAPLTVGTVNDENERFNETIIGAIRQHFSKEFVGRIDYMISFNSKFTDEELDKIIGIEIRKVSEASEITIATDASVSKYFREKYEAKEGLRSIAKVVQNKVSDTIKDKMVKDKKRFTSVNITVKDDKLVIRTK